VRAGVTYKQMLDELLCLVGSTACWRRLDDASSAFASRRASRRAGGAWSTFGARKSSKPRPHARRWTRGLQRSRRRRRAALLVESRELELSPHFAKTFRKAKRAWKFFESQPPSYRRTVKFWVMSAKQEATRERRLQTLIDCCERGTTIRCSRAKPKRSS